MPSRSSIAAMPPLKSRQAALVVAHPGHELRVYGWASSCRVLVHVLTDGSGRNGISRVPSTTKVLNDLGAEAGEVHGSLSDGEVYRAILGQDFAFFGGILDTLANSFIAHDVDMVVGDATEWFNPTHDVCRMLVNAAVDKVRLTTGRLIANYEFCLTEWEQGCREVHNGRCRHLRLEDRLLQRKLDAAGAYVELREEVRQALAARGKEHFRTECLKHVPYPAERQKAPGKQPFYESWGEKKVAQGEYAAVIRYERHMAPLERAIDNHVKSALTTVAAARAGS